MAVLVRFRAQSYSSGNLVNVLLIFSIVDVSPKKMLRLHGWLVGGGGRTEDGSDYDDDNDAVSQPNERRIIDECNCLRAIHYHYTGFFLLLIDYFFLLYLYGLIWSCRVCGSFTRTA